MFAHKKTNTSSTEIRNLLAFFCVILFAFSSWAYGQQESIHEEVVVTARKLPALLSEITRSVTVIDRSEIESIPVHSVQDLLEYALGVDLRQRGPLGVQADASIRGGTFEQALILIDGIKVSDPQTGHHNLNLPLTPEDVERVEVLKGSGSRLYGPNAFTGIINIITRKERHKYVSLGAIAGDHEFAEGHTSLSFPVAASSHRISLGKKKSEGYRPNTDFDTFTISWSSALQVASGEINFFAGHVDKEFGANSFYSDRFPNQWEHTKTTFLHAGAHLKKNGVTFSPRAYWRINKDDFVLDRERPEWYRNFHTTNTTGLEFQLSFTSKFGRTAFGGEVGKEWIESTGLGSHSRTKGGIFFEHQVAPVRHFVVIAGAFAYRYSDWGWRIWPGLEFGLRLSEETRLYASLSRSFRVPTYTELYYSDPANKGNPGLKPEEAMEYEIGTHTRRETIEWNISLFRRKGKNLIDWVRPEKAYPWEAHNITRLNTNGVEMKVRIWPEKLWDHSPVSRIQASYAFLDSKRKVTDLDSKYVLDYLKNQFLLDVEHNLLLSLKQDWRIRYEKRQGYREHILVDTRIFWRSRALEFFLEVTNLFDVQYTEIGIIPMPGRWVMGGIKIHLLSGN